MFAVSAVRLGELCRYLSLVIAWSLLVFSTSNAQTRQLEIWHSQDVDAVMLNSVAAQFNSRRQDNNIRFFPADVLMLTPSSLNKTRLPAGILLPSDKVAVEGFNFVPISEDWISSSVSQDFLDTVTYDDRIHGIPIIGGNQVMLFYNRQLIKTPASTWQELLEQREEVEAKDAHLMGFMCDSPFFLLPFLHAFNGGYFENGEIKVDTHQNIEAVSWYKDMWEKGVFFPECNSSVVIEQFEAGKLAYWLSTDSYSYPMQRKMGDNLGMAALPTIKGNPMRGYFSTIALAVPNQLFSEDDIAMLRRFAVFLQSFETQKMIFQTLHQIPVHERILLSIDLYPTKDFVSAYLQLKQNIAMPSDPKLQLVWNELGREFRYYMRNSMPSSKFLTRAQRAIDRKQARGER